MPSQKFALKKGGPKRLEIRWRIFSQKRTILLDGKELGVIPNESALKQGWTLTAKNGTTLSVKKGSLWGSPFDIRLNGVPLPNTDADLQRRVNNACVVMLYIAVVNIFVGMVASNSRTGYMGIPPEVGAGVLITGIIYAVLAYFVWRWSLIALGLTIIGYSIDTLEILLSGPAALLSLGVVGIILRPLILFTLFRAIQPMRKLRAENPTQNGTRQFLHDLRPVLQAAVMVLVGIIAIVLVVSALSLPGTVTSTLSTAHLPTVATLPQPTATLGPTPTPRPTYTPAPTSTPRPTNTPRPTPTSTPTPVPELAVRLPFSLNSLSVLYSNALDSIVAINLDTNQLDIFNPETGDYKAVDLIDKPTALALSPSGKFAVTGSTSSISYVDLVNPHLIKRQYVQPNNVEGILFPDESWIYVIGTSYGEQQTWMLNLQSGKAISVNYILHPDFRYYNSTIYAPDHKSIYMSGISIIYRVDISNPQFPTSEYSMHEEMEGFDIMSDSMSISEDGSYFYNNAGVILKRSNQGVDDPVNVGLLGDKDGNPLGGKFVLPLGSNWIAQMRENGVVILYTPDESNFTPQNGMLKTVFKPEVIIPRPYYDGAEEAGLKYTYIFVNSSHARYYMIFHDTFEHLGFADGFIARDIPS